MFQRRTPSSTSMLGISLKWTLLFTAYAAIHEHDHATAGHDRTVSLVRRSPSEDRIHAARNQLEVLPDGSAHGVQDHMNSPESSWDVLPGGSVLSVEQNISMALQKRAERQDLDEGLKIDQCAKRFAEINQQFKDRIAKGFTPEQVAKVLKSVMDIIKTVTNFFVAQKFSVEAIEEGCMKLNKGIFDVLFSVLTDIQPKLTEIQKQWDENFKKFFKTTKDVKMNIQDYGKTGKQASLAKAIKSIFMFAVDTVAKFIPDASELIDGVETLVLGVVDSWLAIATGDPVGSVQSIFSGATRSIDALAPGIADNKHYKTIVKGLDPIIGDLNNIVADYTHRIESSKICYNMPMTPKSANPRTCPEQYKLKGVHCTPPANLGADCWAGCGSRAGPCTSFCGPGKACCRKGLMNACECLQASGYVITQGQAGSAYDYHQCVTPGPYKVKPENEYRAQTCGKRSSSHFWCEMDKNYCQKEGGLFEVESAVARKGQEYGTIRAQCDTSDTSPFPWSCSGLCYKNCAPDMQAQSNCQCKKPCVAPFPNTFSMTPSMCAQEPGLLEAWFMETVTGAVMTLMDLYSSVSKAINETGDGDKFTADDLTSTVNSFVEFGKQFAHGKCPFAPL